MISFLEEPDSEECRQVVRVGNIGLRDIRMLWDLAGYHLGYTGSFPL
eukprot:gene17311-biopygen17278